MKRVILLLAVSISSSVAQSVYTNPSSIRFDTTITTITDSAAVWIVNTTAKGVYVYDINIYGEAFSVKDTAFFIPSNDSVRTWIFFASIHNLTYNDFAFIETNLQSGSLVVPLTGTKKYAEAVYAPTQGLSGEPLKSALKTIAQQGHTTLGYTTARDRMYGNIDSNNGVDSIECVYTGRKAKFNTRAGATNNNFNAEHTWPQSKFGSVDPMQSDLHHLFSVDETANSTRSNYPFGKVVSNVTWSVGGSRLGLGYGGYTVFEPRDAHKGDAARAMFYFIIRHGNYGSFWTASPYQETVFREWNKNFRPTQKSKNRNSAIALYQGNRNPFVDHPEFVERINNFAGTATVVTSAQLVASPTVLSFGDIFSVNNPNKKLTLANVGNKALTITSIAFTNSSYVLADTISFLDAKSYRVVTVTSNALPSGDTTGTMTITYNDGGNKQLIIELSGYVVTSVKNQPQQPEQFILHQNYPNPFNPTTTIQYSVGTDAHPSNNNTHGRALTTLKIYDVLGREVATLVNEVKEAGNYSVQWNASKFSSGIYYARLQSGEQVQMKKMLLLR
ncbi:MAG: endonuclease [Bacteroidota bacterium]